LSQTRKDSVLESLSNVLIGYGVALSSQIIIFPLYGVYLPIIDNIAIGAWFTLVSITRSYVLRRWFNRKTIFHGNK
jgi:hypothetical protein